QAQLLRIRQFKGSNESRQLDSHMAQIPPRTAILPLFGPWRLFKLSSKLIDLLVRFADLLDEVERLLVLLFDFVLGQFFITEPKNVFDDAWISLQLVTKCNDLPHDHGRPG